MTEPAFDHEKSCRGAPCTHATTCARNNACMYRSSADIAREVMSGGLEKQRAMREEEDAKIAAGRTPVFPEGSKPTNPKDAIGSNKVPLHLWPETATALGAMGLLDGALKYGRANFREIGVRASIYVDAARRHLGYWFEGEENDPDSGLPHFAHALACIAIVIDAQAAGKLNDDRNVQGGFRPLMDALTPHVARLKELHKEKSPKHYTIQDSR